MMKKHEPHIRTDSILIVDDETAGLRLLADILSNAGYEVRPTEKPQSVMASVMADPPNLILLDVRMPEMSGFELCRRLKQDKRSREIPIIFVSALQDTQDRVQGFEAGGVDFISKPFQEAEVLARVSTHLQLYRIKMHLEDLVSERTADLLQANNEMRENEERFRATFEQAAVGIVHISPEGRFLRINQKFCDILGYCKAEMLERTFHDIAHPDDLDTDLENFDRLLSGKANMYSREKRYIHKNGGFVWVNLTASLVRGDETQSAWFIAVMKDITEVRKMRAERDRILELSQDLICIAGLDGYFKYLNPAWEKTLGYADEELMSKPFLDFVHPDDRASTKRELESLAAGRQTIDFENRYTHRDGSIRHLSWMVTPFSDENLMYATARDITERKQAERKYRTVADFTYAWESWTNMDGMLEYVSPSCERISGYRVQDFMENPSLFRDIIVMEDRGIWEQHKCDSKSDLTLQEVQFRIKNKGGDIRWLEHACRSVIDEHGSLLGFRASNRDITGRKQSEDALRESREKAQMLGTKLLTSREAERARLARELHDDIAQRLAFLNIEVDKLEMGKTSLAEPVRERLKRISQGIGELSSDINAISRRLHPAALDVLGLVRSIESECKNFTRLKDIPVTWDLDSTLQHLPKEMSLCIYRIMQEGMRNILRHARATHVHVTLFKKNERVHFLIQDNGIGFDPASNSKKIGLGIASMEERARLLQGELFIESRPAQGTAVKLALPLKSQDKV